MKFTIVPVTIWPSQATQIEIHSVTLSLSGGASCGFTMLDSNDAPLLCSQVALTPEQYDLWGTDDDYFTGCIFANLNLTPA